METINFMLDIETLGLQTTLPAPVVLQISVVPFLLSSETEVAAPFNKFILPKSSLEAGCQVHLDTVSWWLKQEMGAQEKVFASAMFVGEELGSVLDSLSQYFDSFRTSKDNSFAVWGNGSVFDNTIIGLLYRLTGKHLPWKYNEDVDMRTLTCLVKQITGRNIKEEITFEGTPHDAVDDCRHQIKIVRECFNAIRAK